MTYKPEESTLIAYLYGELSEEQKRQVEEYLSGDEEAQKELDELKATLSIIGELKDKEVDIPTFTFDQSSGIVVGNTDKNGFMRKLMAIAASIVIFLFLGYLTEFNASYTEEGFRVAFGNVDKGYSKEEVRLMIADAIQENNNQLDQRLVSTEDGMKEYVNLQAEYLKTQLVSNRTSSSSIGESDFERQRQEYLSQLKQLLEESGQGQKRYTDQALTDFAIFLDIQRQNDMQVIQTRFNNLEDNTELNRYKTDQIISNLISAEDLNQY